MAYHWDDEEAIDFLGLNALRHMPNLQGRSPKNPPPAFSGGAREIVPSFEAETTGPGGYWGGDPPADVGIDVPLSRHPEIHREPAWEEHRETAIYNKRLEVNNEMLKKRDNLRDPLKFIERWEGNKLKAYSDSRGISTIGVGHRILAFDDDSNLRSVLKGDRSLYNDIVNKKKKLTRDQSLELLKLDIGSKESRIRKDFTPDVYNKLPQIIKNVLINGYFRGDLGTTASPRTMELMKAGKWRDAAREYLDHAGYKRALIDSRFTGIAGRMEYNASIFDIFGSDPERLRK